MTLTFLNEFLLDKATDTALNALLQKCFADADYNGRSYFKQLPHYRIIAKEQAQIVGQLGLDFRVMALNGQPINVLGIIDLCVDANFRGQSIGTKLMQEVDRIAQESMDKVDFLFLVTETPKFYENLGYYKADITTTWLKIDEHKQYGIGTEKITDAFFMMKPINTQQKIKLEGELDLLGYMY